MLEKSIDPHACPKLHLKYLSKFSHLPLQLEGSTLFSSMSSENPQPFINNGAYYKATNSYVPFPSQSDAMLASLQLFHEVPCRIMNLIISTVTHPDFDTKQVTLNSSIDVIKVTEEARLQDRMAVVHRRSLNADGYMEQTKLPHFALYEVLDIVHAERMERIKTIFGKTLHDDEASLFNVDILKDDVLSNMSLVHRSWTFPAQQTIGRLVCIRQTMGAAGRLFHVQHQGIFGPWTTAVAILFAPDYLSTENIDREAIEFGLLKKLEVLHRALLSFPNLKRIYFTSCIPFLTTWFDFTVREMVRQNTYLEELTLESTHWSRPALFDLDPLLENGNVSDNLRSLSIQGIAVSDKVRNSLSRRSSFARLRSLSFGNTDSAASKTLLTLLSMLSSRSDPHLNYFFIYGGYHPTFSVVGKNLSPRQCTSLFEHLTTLHIKSHEALHWFRWISPFCSRLEKIAFMTKPSADISSMLSLLPATTQSLNLQFYEASNPQHLETICLCVGKLLEIPGSSLHSALKLIAFSIPCVKPLLGEPEYNAAIKPFRAKIREFCTEMNAACGSVAIKFDFSWWN